MIKKIKFDILALSIISIIYFISLFKYGEYFTNIIIDTGRELYYPELMLKGKLLYKDLFNLFGPLGYQINCLWYRLFGIKISSLLFAGEVCSLCIIYVIYFISRYFLNIKLSFAFILFIMSTCVFALNVFNFLLPYSFSLLYAYLFFLFSVLSFLYAFKSKNNDIFLILSFLFMGFSITSKYEYTPFIFVLLFYTLFVFKKGIKSIFINLVALCIVPVISYGALFVEGVTIADLLKNQALVYAHIKSESLHYFYTNYTGTFFSFDLLNHLFSAGINYKILFLFFPYIIYGIFLYDLLNKIIHKNFNLKSDVFFVFIIISIISMLKTGFIMKIDLYGSYTVSLPLITFLAFVVNKVKDKDKKDSLNKIFAVLLIFISFLSVLNLRNYVYLVTPLKTEKGVIYSQKYFVKQTEILLEYLKKNVSKEKTLLVMPEGVMFNYITGYDMKLYNYYSLLPTFIDTFGIDNILKDIENAKIDYIILVNNRDLSEYGGTSLNCNYIAFLNMTEEERKICSYIVYKYEKQDVAFNHNFSGYSLYKRR